MPYGILAADQIQTSTTGVSLGAGNATRFKNRIINGDMRIDQRNAGASVSLPDGAVNYFFPADRWACSRANGATATGQQSSTAPTGFINSLVITNGTGITVGSTGQGYVFQCIEGLNVSDLGWGTANAKTLTLSFWVQSSITGTHSGVFSNGALNRSYAFTYSIPVANTWTQISITIAGDTTGTWLTTNGRGLYVLFNNGSGSTYLTSAGSWTAGNYYGATGSVALNSVTGSTWYITGVQLEVGSSATGFEYVDYTTQLQMCQRYYSTGIVANGFCGSATDVYVTVNYPVAMRTTPTTSQTAVIQVFEGSTNYTQSAINISYVAGNANGKVIGLGSYTGLTQYRPCVMNFNGASGTLTQSAEL